MKCLSMLLIINLLAIFSVYSQGPVNNFKLEESALIWQKVYETPMTFQQLIDRVKDSGVIKTLEIREGKLTGDLNLVPFDYVGAGYKNLNTPMYMIADNFSAFVIIDYQEGKYRVTAKKIEINCMESTPFSKKGDIIQGEAGALNNSKTEFRKSFHNAPSIIWNYTFSTIFDLKEKAKENW